MKNSSALILLIIFVILIFVGFSMTNKWVNQQIEYSVQIRQEEKAQSETTNSQQFREKRNYIKEYTAAENDPFAPVKKKTPTKEITDSPQKVSQEKIFYEIPLDEKVFVN